MHQIIIWKVIHWNKNWEKYLFKTANIFYDVEKIPDWVDLPPEKWNEKNQVINFEDDFCIEQESSFFVPLETIIVVIDYIIF